MAQEVIPEEDRRMLPDEYAKKVGEYLDEAADEQEPDDDDEGPITADNLDERR